LNLEQLQIEDNKHSGLSAEDIKRRQDAFRELRPKGELGYTNLFWTWMREFHAKYLDCDITGKDKKFKSEIPKF